MYVCVGLYMYLYTHTHISPTINWMVQVPQRHDIISGFPHMSGGQEGDGGGSGHTASAVQPRDGWPACVAAGHAYVLAAESGVLGQSE